MNYRATINSVLALSLLAMAGCDGEAKPTAGPPAGGPYAIELGVSCDLEKGCGASDLICQPQWDGGEMVGGICMLAQGEPCTPNAEFSLCGRGLSCVESDHEPETSVCLPMSCIAHNECAVGQVCSSGQCISPSSCDP